MSSSASAQVQDDNENENDQEGDSMSGDAIVGQVTGVNSAGHVSYDGTNRTENTTAESGESHASNGIGFIPVTPDTHPRIHAADHEEGHIDDLFDDDDEFDVADAATGDAMGGQVAGITTSPTGFVTAVAANTTLDSDIETGTADAFNDALVRSGDGIGGQALGIVSAGRTSLDATNLTDDAEILTGDALGTNGAEAFTGDGVGGQVLGVVTAFGGNDDLVFANTSRSIDIVTGDATTFNDNFAILGPIDIGGIIRTF